MQVQAILLAAALMLAPLGARATDLVVWFEKEYYPGEDQAVRDLVVAFEQKTGKQVDVTFFSQEDLPPRIVAALDTGAPPDFVFGQTLDVYAARWAYDGRLVELADALGPLASLFDPDALEIATLLDRTIGRRGLYALPMGYGTNHLHVWKSLLERAGFTLADIPKQWEPFWSFWCDQVQPAVRKAVGNDDVYGVGLAMAAEAPDTNLQFAQFVAAYEADWVTRDGRVVINQPLVRDRLIKALDSYTSVYRKGCTPPDSVNWLGIGNNKAFVAQNVVMTPNPSMSLPNMVKSARLEDYATNVATIEWPSGAHGKPLRIATNLTPAVVFKVAGHDPLAKQFVRFLVEDGWLAHWLDFVGDRMLPPLPALLDTPFWLTPSDLHRLRSAVQFLTQPRGYTYGSTSPEWRVRRVWTEHVWSEAVQRVAADGISPEQAVDGAIARIKQILSE